MQRLKARIAMLGFCRWSGRYWRGGRGYGYGNGYGPGFYFGDDYYDDGYYGDCYWRHGRRFCRD